MKSLLFFITLFLFIFAYSITVSHFDFDLWARLIAGMGVIDGCHVLKNDFLSYTPVHTWWDHEWGAGVIFYIFLKFFGPYSLIILQAFMLFAIFFTASKIIKIRTNISPYHVPFYFVTLMAVIQNLNNPIRCHMFSFVFFTIFIYILEKVRQGSNKLLILIPPIILIWNNIHGGVAAGIGLLILYAIGEFLNKKPFAKYLITLVISSLVMLINPWGIDYLKFLFMANTLERKEIIEWWGLFCKFNLFKYIIFKIFILITIITEIMHYINKWKIYKNLKTLWEHTDKVKCIILLATLYLAISHVKLMPFFAISALCFVYEDFYKLVNNIKITEKINKLFYILILILSLLTFISKDFSLPDGIDIYPVKEVEFIKQNKLSGKTLTNFGYGSFVSYKLYPQNLIFMDGRYEEVYYDYMIPLLKQFHLAGENWDELLKYFPPDIMILEKSYPIYQKLQNEKTWKPVYEGNKFGVFLPVNKSEREFIKPSDDIKYYKNNLFKTDIKF